MLISWPALVAQSHVVYFNIYDQGELVSPADSTYSISLYDPFEQQELPVSTYAGPQSTYKFAFIHRAYPPDYQYCIEVAGPHGTLNLWLKTYFVDWKNAHLLIPLEPGIFTWDLADLPAAQRTVAPVRAIDYWRKN